jgi:hypothetical protein
MLLKKITYLFKITLSKQTINRAELERNPNNIAGNMQLVNINFKYNNTE